MVQFEILSGKTAGARWVARRFPVRVGRSPDSDLQLEEQGVWDHHFQIALNPGVGFVLETEPEAFVIANGQPTGNAVLRNGDTIEIGAVKLQFWLSEARLRGLIVRESLFWIIVAGISMGQIALIYWLID